MDTPRLPESHAELRYAIAYIYSYGCVHGDTFTDTDRNTVANSYGYSDTDFYACWLSIHLHYRNRYDCSGNRRHW